MEWRNGDVIARVQPFAHVLSQAQRGSRCDNCFASSNDLKRCTACKVLRYCNSSCQRKDWQLHKTECKCLLKVSPNIPTESVRLLLRILLHIKNGDHTRLDWDVGWRSFSDLQSHVTEILQDEKRSKEFAHLVQTLKEYTHGNLNLPPDQDLLDIYGKMVINTFSICDPEMQPIGSGLYISPSLLDHSCEPNAVTVFDGTTLTVTCVSRVPHRNPKQVFISYIDQLAPHSDRKRQLQEQYYFTCHCSRCSDQEMDGLMLSAQCPQSNCNGTIAAIEDGYGSCSVCQSVCRAESHPQYVDTVRQVIEESKDAIHKLDAMKKEDADPNTRLQICVKLLKKQRVLSPYNVYKVNVLDRAMDACIDGCQWKPATEYGEQTIKPYLKLHPPFSPTVGLQLMKVGKLQLYLQQLDTASLSLQQAETILRVTHGTSHPVYQELSMLLDQCSEEKRLAAQRHLEDS